MFKHYKQFNVITAIVTIVLPMTVFSADIFKADRQFKEQDYINAKVGYSEAAKLGNPHAYYQLATMYSKGLGVEKDALNALLNFSLASEYNFHNAQAIVDKMLNTMSAEQQASVGKILANYQKTQGKDKINQTYFPSINEKTLGKKVLFDGLPDQETKYIGDDDDILVNDYLENLPEDDEISLIMSTPPRPVIILEHDVNTDGSIRYYDQVQEIGSPLNLVKNYVMYPVRKPTFDGKPIDFVNRVYIGAATYSKFTLIDENEKLYQNIRLTRIKLEKGTTLQDQYQYAMLLLNFPWITQEEGEVEQRLLTLAEKGHPLAMLEYGMKLYREQREIPHAIDWIAQASKYGIQRAEYRIAKILQTSPWVHHDDKKALFWYEVAMEKGHSAATLRATEIKLTSKDKTLYDLPTAINYLAQVAESESNNPEYYYLLALSHKDRENRDFTKVVDNLQTAINKGRIQNWDVSEWQSLLTRLTTGSVYITDS